MRVASRSPLCKFAVFVLFLLAALSSRAQDNGGQAGGASLFAFEIGAGPLIGLDRPLRGGAVSAGLFLDLGRVFGRSFRGIEQGVEAAALYDLSFRAAAARADLTLCMGPELRVRLGYELPLGRATLLADGATLSIKPGAAPNSFAICALLGAFGEAGAGGPRFSVEAEFGWSAYRLADPGSASATRTVQSGISGFASGFRLGAIARARWGPAAAR